MHQLESGFLARCWRDFREDPGRMMTTLIKAFLIYLPLVIVGGMLVLVVAVLDRVFGIERMVGTGIGNHEPAVTEPTADQPLFGQEVPE